MPDFRVLLRCVGEAVCANAVKALAGLVPLGGVLYDVASDAMQRLREADQDGQMRALVEQTAAADPAEVKAAALDVAALVAADQPPAVRERLAAYLAVVPAAVRQSLRRPADPSGKSLPFTFSPRRPEDLLRLLPSRLPRFTPGDPVPGQGDWVLDELLGVGGFGEVWKARHAHFDGIAPVAIKFCLDPDARERLLKHEARVLNQVMRQGRHPGIVPLLDASLSADPPCLKYEYVEGGDLSGLVRDWQDAPPPDRWRQASAVVARLARAVAFAHRLDPPVVHRDLKPGNVLLCHGVPRVTDFGIGGAASRQALEQAQQGSTSRGELTAAALRGSHTPLYASPQQARGEAPDPRDDVHALGVIWHQLLCGDLLGGPPTGLWSDELEEAGMPRELVRLLGSCVAAKAERRPADAGVLADRLDAHLTPAPVAPPPPVAAVSVSEGRLAGFLAGGQPGVISSLLDLTNKRVGDAGVAALARCPRLAGLDTLMLGGCDVGDDGIEALAASPHVANLKRLVLFENRVGDRGLIALAGCGHLANLEFLDLGCNRIGDEGVKALAASPHFARLGELLIVSNHFGDEGALALAASPHLANLAWLKPLDNRISEKGADALKKAFGRRVRVM